jgi:hypothetical protein
MILPMSSWCHATRYTTDLKHGEQRKLDRMKNRRT